MSVDRSIGAQAVDFLKLHYLKAKVEIKRGELH